ncbi:MAG: type I-U CRISPR-associated protein Csb2 [Bifidobacteriaceae bacterium]|jgi:CRISPR-associated protein Csb2|nr:type I-U CRISPR-associated protein Csb2 [Bifidobacteriaceae bacterium]
MPFVISARFLLGTYQGSDGSGAPELYPSPDRLYKALVSTAYRVFGFEADHSQAPHTTAALPDSTIQAALSWLESNPPTAIRLPKISTDTNDTTDREHITVYRDKGTITKGAKKISPAVASISTSYPSGAAGAILWQWKNAPDHEMVRAFQTLVGEVPYLGEAVSSVVMAALEIADDGYPAQSSVTLATDRHDFYNDITFAVPLTGRLQELQEAYKSAYPAKKKTPGKDKEEERNVLRNDANQRVDFIGYTFSKTSQTGRITPPWPRGIVLPVHAANTRLWNPEQSEFVEWAVALHRFLIKQWGLGCSPYLTGQYAKSAAVTQPANNVSIQVVTPDPRLSAELLRSNNDTHGGAFFLLMIPADIPPEDYQRLYDICTSIEGQHLYYHGSQQKIMFGAPSTADLTAAWQAPAAGMHRFWSPSPLGIYETRAMPDPSGKNRRWGAREAMQLSLAHVWRDFFNSQDKQKQEQKDQEQPLLKPKSREQKYWDSVRKVAAPTSGFRVFGARTVLRTNMAQYSHHRDASNILKGFSGLLEIKGDAMSTAVAAIGQSRHLGGGFLVPVDVPEQLLDEKGAPSWSR